MLLTLIVIGLTGSGARADTLLKPDQTALLNQGAGQTITTDSSIHSACDLAARDYGNGRGSSFIDPACVQSRLASAKPNSALSTDDGSLFAFASGNMLVLNKQDKKGTTKTEIIAGNNSHLVHPIAAALDTKNQEIAVIDGDKSILIFSSKFGGNVAPLRKIENSALQGAISLVIDSKNDKIIVASENGAIQLFSRFADISGRRPQSVTSPLKIQSMVQAEAGTSMSLDLDDDELFVLDKAGNQILAFDLPSLEGAGTNTSVISESAPVKPKRVISGLGTGLNSPQAIAYSKKSGRIEVIQLNDAGTWSVLTFSRSANGNASPLFTH